MLAAPRLDRCDVSADTGARCGTGYGEERGGQRDGAGRGDRAVRSVGEIRAGLEAHELRRLDQAVEERGDAGPALGARPVVILAVMQSSA